MARDNSVFKDIYNHCLDLIGRTANCANLPSETELARQLSASRTTIRAVLERLNAVGLIRWHGRNKLIMRQPTPDDYFSDAETQSTSEKIEFQFMEFILGGDLRPGDIFRESELAREFGVGTPAIREFLIKFSRFGLIAKEPNRHWILNGFTLDFAEELFFVRESLEMRAFDDFMARCGAEELTALQLLATAHEALCANIDRDYAQFSRLDDEFHETFLVRSRNRFVADFFEMVSMIFHFHYRWDKQSEKARNHVAAEEHLAVLQAILVGDARAARAAFQAHLKSAHLSLLTSVAWADDDTS
ncbi:GntR family transcriptional regulator [Devosia algicola]|uniref:GntR family transcriptional regulator n=1 Tax=Devosia algicola TaxID=3026418 RepID=A0ABY7YNK0_9HYPH|nr:GntR family transcriptional regulator [Devosia algicola]WDR02728.1 GntR family transcriptional regulator [Devosia algicola]